MSNYTDYTNYTGCDTGKDHANRKRGVTSVITLSIPAFPCVQKRKNYLLKKLQTLNQSAYLY